MSINSSICTRLLTIGLLLLASTTHADLIGEHTFSGILNVTFSRPGLSPVKTVETSGETWTFNSDHTFSRGTLTGRWKQKGRNTVEVTYNRRDYLEHLESFWTYQGIDFKNIRILKNKVLVQQISNGLSATETLDYQLNLAIQGKSIPVRVSITASFVEPIRDGYNNAALMTVFPTMSPQSSISSASFTMTYYSAPVLLSPDSDDTTYQVPDDYMDLR